MRISADPREEAQLYRLCWEYLRLVRFAYPYNYATHTLDELGQLFNRADMLDFYLLFFSDLSGLLGSVDAACNLKMGVCHIPCSSICTSYIVNTGNYRLASIERFVIQTVPKVLIYVWFLFAGLVHRHLRSWNLSSKPLHCIPNAENRSGDGLRGYAKYIGFYIVNYRYSCITGNFFFLFS